MAYASCEAYNFNIFSTWFIIISIIVFSLFSGISRGPCDNWHYFGHFKHVYLWWWWLELNIQYAGATCMIHTWARGTTINTLTYTLTYTYLYVVCDQLSDNCHRTVATFTTCVRVVAGSSRSVQASVKCMMDGCRTMVPAEFEVCDACRRKQMEAYEGITL